MENGLTQQIDLQEGIQVVSGEQTQQIRDSIKDGIERVVKPIIEKRQAQGRTMRLNRELKIGGLGDIICHPTRPLID